MIRKKRLILLGCLLVIGLISGMALAQDGRINPARKYHFGGDTLYCNHDDGLHAAEHDRAVPVQLAAS